MLELSYLFVLVVAFYCSKVAIVNRVEEETMFAVAMILFAGLAFASLSVRPVFAPDETVSMEPMLWLTGIASLLNFVLLTLAMTDRLPSRETNPMTNNAN